MNFWAKFCIAKLNILMRTKELKNINNENVGMVEISEEFYFPLGSKGSNTDKPFPCEPSIA